MIIYIKKRVRVSLDCIVVDVANEKIKTRKTWDGRLQHETYAANLKSKGR